MQYSYLVLFSVLLASGQILFKKAALVSNNADGFLIGLINGWLVSALVLYGFATLLWIWILRTVPLSIAYPFAALGFVLVPAAAYFLFGEEISLRFVFGTLFIIVGILLTSVSA